MKEGERRMRKDEEEEKVHLQDTTFNVSKTIIHFCFAMYVCLSKVQKVKKQ